MPTQCSADLFGFAPVEGRRVEAGFDGGTITSDAGALLLGATDRVVGLVGRLAGCFVDARSDTRTSTTMSICAMTPRWRCWPASSWRGARIALRLRARAR